MNKMGKYRKAVFVVVYRKEKNKILYLVLKRKLHWIGWEFPKGGVEKKENLFKTVKREVFEESGHKTIEIKRFAVKGKYKYNEAARKDRKFDGQTYTLFSAQVSGGRTKIDRIEHSKFRWLEFEKAIKILTYNDQKKCLKIANRFLKK